MIKAQPLIGVIDFVHQIVRPALSVLPLPMQGPLAEMFLTEIVAQESQFQNIAQIGGPALAYPQIEPATHLDVWENYIDLRPDLARSVTALLDDGFHPVPSSLIPCPKYAMAICRIICWRFPGAIPADVVARAAYYKMHYNTPKGAATPEEYLSHYEDLIAPYAHQIWLSPTT